MMRSRVLLAVVLACSFVLCIACAPQKPALVGCKPEVAKIAVTNGQGMWAVISTDITISNPNPFPITADGLTLKLDNGTGIQAYEEVYKKFDIPAQGKITETVSCNVTFMGIVSEMVMNKGLASAKAVGAAAPIWKGLPSAKPDMLTQAIWDSLPSTPSTFTYETSIYTRAGSEQKFVKATGTYPK